MATMEPVLLALIEQLDRGAFVLIAILLVFILFTYKIGSWKEIFNNHNKRLDNVEAIKDTVISLSTKIDLIYQNTLSNPLVQSQSPISLTESGKTISKEVGANDIFDKHWDKLLKLIDKKSPKNAYDIQQCAFSIAKEQLIELLNEDDLVNIKKVAFSHGILVEDIMSVFGILLRNKTLEVKDIPISDVDKHDNKS